MWTPETVGDVIAERDFIAKKPSGRKVRIRVRFGRPVQGKGGVKRDPWWCPVEVKGAGLDSFRPVGGIDSLQALILGLELITRVLPREAARVGLRVEWLGDSERLVLARHSLSRDMESALLTFFGTLRDVSAILASDRAEERQATIALRTIVESARPRNTGRVRPRQRKRKASG
jgi:hypothetical protein